MINNYGFERLVCNHEISDLELYQWNDKWTIEQRDILWKLFRNEYIPSIIVPESDGDDNKLNKKGQTVRKSSDKILQFINYFTRTNDKYANDLNETLYSQGLCLTFAQILKATFKLNIYGKGRLCATCDANMIRNSILKSHYMHYLASKDEKMFYDIFGATDIVREYEPIGIPVVMLTDDIITEIKNTKELKDVAAFTKFIDNNNKIFHPCLLLRKLSDSELVSATTHPSNMTTNSYMWRSIRSIVEFALPAKAKD